MIKDFFESTRKFDAFIATFPANHICFELNGKLVMARIRKKDNNIEIIPGTAEVVRHRKPKKEEPKNKTKRGRR